MHTYFHPGIKYLLLFMHTEFFLKNNNIIFEYCWLFHKFHTLISWHKHVTGESNHIVHIYVYRYTHPVDVLLYGLEALIYNVETCNCVTLQN